MVVNRGTFTITRIEARWGWTLVVNPDGTTTAWNKNKTRTRPRCSTATDRPPGPD